MTLEAPAGGLNDLDPERAVLALRAKVLAWVIAGAVHDIRTPLNTIGLRLPLLTDGLDGSPGGAESAAGQVRSLREQLDRIKDLVSRLAEVCEPAAPLGYLDVAGYLGQVVGALGYEARLAHVELAVEPARGSVRTTADPARAARLVLCTVARALAATALEGRLVGRASSRGGTAIVELDRTPGAQEPGAGHDWDVLTVAAAALGGRLERGPGEQGLERLTLRMPGSERT